MRVLARDIVVLVYANEGRCARVVQLCEITERIEVCCREGIWKEEDGTIHQIGEHRPCGINSVRRGVIGVYDRSRIEQLNSMMYAMQEATSGPACPAGR